MIYCVVPTPLADELYPKLVEHYEGDENVTVIVDRREADRRARRSQPQEDPETRQRRVVRDLNPVDSGPASPSTRRLPRRASRPGQPGY
jgi:hypothetical protein